MSILMKAMSINAIFFAARRDRKHAYIPTCSTLICILIIKGHTFVYTQDKEQLALSECSKKIKRLSLTGFNRLLL